MLVLTRKKFEKIVIGDNIEVTVMKIEGNRCRLSIKAPSDVRVMRGEIPRKGHGDAGSQSAS